jgi:hypothetical protein
VPRRVIQIAAASEGAPSPRPVLFALDEEGQIFKYGSAPGGKFDWHLVPAIPTDAKEIAEPRQRVKVGSL